jgi:hypothetical protein
MIIKNKKANVWITLFVFMVLILAIASASMLWISKKNMANNIYSARCVESPIAKERLFNYIYNKERSLDKAVEALSAIKNPDDTISVWDNCNNFYILYRFKPIEPRKIYDFQQTDSGNTRVVFIATNWGNLGEQIFDSAVRSQYTSLLTNIPESQKSKFEEISYFLEGDSVSILKYDFKTCSLAKAAAIENKAKSILLNYDKSRDIIIMLVPKIEADDQISESCIGPRKIVLKYDSSENLKAELVRIGVISAQ